MPQSRTEYEKDSIKRAVWLIVDVPGTAAPRILKLQLAMREFAVKWIGCDKTRHSDPYAHETGVTEAKKLRIFAQER